MLVGLETLLPSIPWKLRVSIRECKGTGDIIGGTKETRVIKKELEPKSVKEEELEEQKSLPVDLGDKSSVFIGGTGVITEDCRRNHVGRTG